MKHISEICARLICEQTLLMIIFSSSSLSQYVPWCPKRVNTQQLIQSLCYGIIFNENTQKTKLNILFIALKKFAPPGKLHIICMYMHACARVCDVRALGLARFCLFPFYVLCMLNALMFCSEWEKTVRVFRTLVWKKPEFLRAPTINLNKRMNCWVMNSLENGIWLIQRELASMQCSCSSKWNVREA